MSLTLADSVQQVKQNRVALPEALGRVVSQASVTSANVVRFTNMLRSLTQQINQAQADMAELRTRVQGEIDALRGFIEPYNSEVGAYADSYAANVSHRWTQVLESEKIHHETTTEIVELFAHTREHVHDADGELQSAMQGGLTMIGDEVARLEKGAATLSSDLDALEHAMTSGRTRALDPLTRLGEIVAGFQERGEASLARYRAQTQPAIDALPDALSDLLSSHLQAPMRVLLEETRNRLDQQVIQRGASDCTRLLHDGLQALLGVMKAAERENDALAARLAKFPAALDESKGDLSRFLDHLETLLNLLGLLARQRVLDLDESFFQSLEARTGVRLDPQKLMGHPDALSTTPALRVGLLRLGLSSDAQQARQVALDLERHLSAVPVE